MKISPSALLGLFALAGCTSGGWSPAKVTAGVPTYWQDVRPLMQAHCLGCHATGGISPVAFDSPELATTYASEIAADTAAGLMPPWPPGGASPAYLHARTLSSAEKQTLADWVAGGSQVGDPAHPAADGVPDSPSIGTPDRVVNTGVDYVPNTALSDEYRCFLVDLGETQDRMVTGFQITPGNGKIVHHVITTFYDATQKTKLQALDASDANTHDGRAGWPCFGGSVPQGSGIVQAAWLGGWVPGVSAVPLPLGTGVKVHAGTLAVLQLHYNLKGGSDPDRTQLALKYAPVGTEASLQELATITVLQPTLNILANDPSSVFSATKTAQQWAGAFYPDGDAYLLTVFGHEHLLGKSLKVTLTRSTGESFVALEIPRWDFHWQGGYVLADPVVVHPADQLSIQCTYDNTQAHRDAEGYVGPMASVSWGEGTQDEMCLAFLQFSDQKPTP